MRTSFNSLGLSACLLLWIVGTAAPVAQTTLDGGGFQNQFPDPVQYTQPAPETPGLKLTRITGVDFSGPILSGPTWVDGQVEIFTGSGLVRATWDGDFDTVTVAVDSGGTRPAEPESSWAMSPTGKYRVSPVDEWQLVAQKSCRGCASGWRRGWRLRVPGLAQAPPLITARRVYYGAADNRVYGVKRKNGHRVWATPLDGRVLRPLALWVAAGRPDDAAAAILAVPEPGKELIVLDALGGRVSQRYPLAAHSDKIVGAPLATPDGLIILARQGYTDQDAGLIVLKILELGPNSVPTAEIAATGYNRPTSDEAPPVEPASE